MSVPFCEWCVSHKPVAIAASVWGEVFLLWLCCWIVRRLAAHLPAPARHAAYKRVALAALYGFLGGVLGWGLSLLVRG